MAMITLNILGQELLVNADTIVSVHTVRLSHEKWGVKVNWLPQNSAVVKLNQDGYFTTEALADVAKNTLINLIHNSQTIGVDPTVYKAAGSIQAANILNTLLVADNQGKVFNVSDNFVTTTDFIEGANQQYLQGTNIVIVETTPDTYKFDVLGGMTQVTADNVYVFDPSSRFDNMNVLESLNLLNQDIEILDTTKILFNKSGTDLQGETLDEIVKELLQRIQALEQ